MALRKERPEALELYRKLLLGFAGVAAFLPALLNIVSFLMPLVAAALVCVPALWWKYRPVRVITRGYSIVLTTVVPVLLIVLACMGHFHTEYFSLLSFATVVLPAMAFAATHDVTVDVIIMRVLSFVHLVSVALIIGYVIDVDSWMKSVLLGAVALVLFILSVMIRPPFENKSNKKTAD